jgi:hypothetical protein
MFFPEATTYIAQTAIQIFQMTDYRPERALQHRGYSKQTAPYGLIGCMRGRIWIVIALVAACRCMQAQWLNQPIAGAPRTPDGTVNMTGPVPRLNGKADLSGIWQVQAEPRPPGLFGLGESPNSKYFRDILADFKPGEEPLQPAGAEIPRRHSPPGGTLQSQPELSPGRSAPRRSVAGAL